MQKIRSLTEPLNHDGMKTALVLNPENDHPVLEMLARLTPQFEEYLGNYPQNGADGPYAEARYIQTNFDFFREATAQLDPYSLQSQDIVAISIGLYDLEVPLHSHMAATRIISIGYAAAPLDQDRWGSAISAIDSIDLQKRKRYKPENDPDELRLFQGRLEEIMGQMNPIAEFNNFNKDILDDAMRTTLRETTAIWRNGIGPSYMWVANRLSPYPAEKA